MRFQNYFSFTSSVALGELCNFSPGDSAHRNMGLELVQPALVWIMR